MEELRQYRDMNLWLIVVGVAEVLLGVLLTVATFFLSVTLIVVHFSDYEGGLSVAQTISVIAIYGGLSAMCIWFGVATYHGRRWVRAILTALGWLALVAGMGGILFGNPFINNLFEAYGAASTSVSGDVISNIKTFLVILVSVLYLLIPLFLILFYGNRHTKRTCEELDPVERWTDRIPMPVLILIVSALVSLATPLSAIQNSGLFPVFGILIAGVPGYALHLISFLVALFIIRGLIKLDIAAWWVAIIYNSLFFMSAIVTSTSVEFSELIKYSSVTPQVRDMYDKMDTVNTQSLVWSSVAGLLLYVAYMLWIHRYFTPEYKNPDGILPNGIESDPDRFKEAPED